MPTDHESVVRFIEGWQALSSASSTSNLVRARRLIDGIRPLLRWPPEEATVKRASPSIHTIRQLFAGLAAPLSTARSTGSFIDVWAVAGVRRKELPNAAVLAWLIDPNGSHGQGALCLSALLALADRKSPLSLSGVPLESARVQPEERPLGSDRDRVDIVVETADILIFIEVKIDAAEGQAQLSRYVESAARVAEVRATGRDRPPKPTLTIFLSPRAPSEKVPEVVHINWRDLANVLTSASRRADAFAGLLIRSFAAHTRSFG